MSNAKLEIFEKTVELLNEDGSDIAAVIPDYSGRGMYGETTPAINTFNQEVSAIEIGVYMAVAMEELGYGPLEEVDIIPQHVDNLGLGMVYY